MNSIWGDIMGDMNSRRGKILGMDPLDGGMQKIRANVPLAEMYQYSIDLRSKNSGQGFVYNGILTL